MKYFEPLNFEVQRQGDHLRIRIWQYFWWRFAKALLWTAAWALVAFASIQLIKMTVLASTAVTISALMCLGGLVIANSAINDCTLWLRSDTLKFRMIRMFTRQTKSFSLADVSGFGFGFFSHGGPVLKFESAGKWYVLAQGVIERDVEKLVGKINESGYTIP